MTDEDEVADGATDGGRHGEAAGGAGGGAGQPSSDELPSGLGAIEEAVDRPAATVGLVVATLALVASVLTWTESPPFVPAVAGTSSTLGAGLAVVATLAFAARRHGVVDREPGAAVAGTASAGVGLAALARFLAPAAGGGSDPVVGAGLPLAFVAGFLGVGLAITDRRGVTAAALLERGRRTAVGLGLVVGAFLVMGVLSIPLVGLEFTPVAGIFVSVVLADVVFASVALGFLLVTDRGVGYVDLGLPDLRDLAYFGLGMVALFGVLITVRLLTLALELPATPNQITQAARQGHPETLLVLVPLQFLLVAPAEELLNRNVIQKYLYDTFSRPGAVVVASAVFASAHVFSYGGDSVVGMAVSLTSVFLLSLVLGVIYERTENLTVPIAVHGTFNALQFLLLYVAIVYGPEDVQAGMAMPW
jgi:membrane protease YdiL (CAAX protease family)